MRAVAPKASDKQQTSVRDDGPWYPMQIKHMSDVDLSILVDLVLGVDGYEVGRFGESIHNHSNRIKLAVHQW
jgi:hypothetical protein